MKCFLAYCGMTDNYIWGWTGDHPLKDYIAEVDKKLRGYGAGIELIEVTPETLFAFALHFRERGGSVPNGLFEVEEVRPKLTVVPCSTT